jgi:hypothetical protein
VFSNAEIIDIEDIQTLLMENCMLAFTDLIEFVTSKFELSRATLASAITVHWAEVDLSIFDNHLVCLFVRYWTCYLSDVRYIN